MPSLLIDRSSAGQFVVSLTLIFFPCAMSAIDFLAVFPDLVRGNPETETDILNAATGPTNFRTRVTSSDEIAVSFREASEIPGQYLEN